MRAPRPLLPDLMKHSEPRVGDSLEVKRHWESEANVYGMAALLPA